MKKTKTTPLPEKNLDRIEQDKSSQVKSSQVKSSQVKSSQVKSRYSFFNREYHFAQHSGSGAHSRQEG